MIDTHLSALPRGIRVAVVGGGQNSEHEVSLASAASVRAALDPAVFEVQSLTIDRDGYWLRADGQPLAASRARSFAAAVALIADCDVAFPAVHGPLGEDGSLAALFELAGVPYVGAGVRGGALAMDKWATKLVAADLGIRTAPGRLVDAGTAAGLRPDRFPVVVKPVAAGSSHGVGLVHRIEDLDGALANALAHDDRVLVEEFVTGREVDLAVLERADGSLLVGPPLEIVVAGAAEGTALFDSEQKYDGSAVFRIPAPLAETEEKALREAALALFSALGCRSVARFDFFLTAEGPVLNEVNTMPGMTAQSQVPKMFESVGLSYPALLDELLRSALDGGPDRR
ncbi:D-alanine--D-alanine ligase family protein [Streptacidiphilus sp. N1-12]|uniref:D-alanine--D-alanine ligase n=2 Tax=Streptacidiphilus alkalitolerans TaxID=3342712 RepID=A0ABV6XDE0_9ACTN